MSTPESRWAGEPVQRAFPGQTTVMVDGQERVAHNQGMTLRQWYAGQALSGIMSNEAEVRDCCEAVNSGDIDGMWWDAAARDAFKLADAMLNYEAKEEWAAKHKKATPEESR